MNVPAGLSGTVPGGYSVTVGDDGSSHATVTLGGRVVNDGTLQVDERAEVLGHGAVATLVNAGTLDVPSSGDDPVVLDTALDNLGLFEVSGTVDATLGDGQAWANGTTGSDATITVAPGGSITAISSPGRSAPFTQDGTIDNAGSFEVAEPVQIAGGSICGGLDVGSHEDNLGGGLAWAPQLNPGAACAAGISTDVVTVDSVPITLTSDVPAGYTLTLSSFDFGHGEGQSNAQLSTLGPLVNDGTLVADGGSLVTVNGTFTNQGTFVAVLDNGDPMTLTAPQTLNVGQLEVEAGSLDVNGSLENRGTVSLAGPNVQLELSDNYTQDADGTLADPLTPVSTTPVTVGGTATLAGTLSLGSSAPKGTQMTLVTDDGTQGTFSTVIGPYTLSYSPTAVTATRRAKPAA